MGLLGRGSAAVKTRSDKARPKLVTSDGRATAASYGHGTTSLVEVERRRQAVPIWLTWLSIAALGIGVGCAIWIASDLVRHPAKMKVMNLVWPLCALFGGLLIAWFYARHGRATGTGESPPKAVAVAKGTLHCGAGCSLGDLVAETLALNIPAILIPMGYPGLFDEKIFAVWIADFILAFAFGIVFQFYAIAPMRGLGLADGLAAAFKADALSLTSWQIGMYAAMAAAHFWLFPRYLEIQVDASMPVFWFAMQFAMLAGFITSYPVNWWLISSGLKERM